MESTPKNAIQVLESQFAERKDQFLAVLPTNCTFEKFERVVKTAVIQNQDLLKADRSSLFLACFKCAQDGLLPDGREAALVLYGKNVQYMPMIGGILKKIRNSGELRSISAHVVHELDEFDYCLGDKESIHHKPARDERGNPICVYAIVETKDNALYREVMSVKEIEKIRSISRAKAGSPWTQHWGEMAKKTVIRRLSKRLPMSSDLDQIIRRDDEMYDFDNSNNFIKNKKMVIDQINAEIENKVIEDLEPVKPEIIEAHQFGEENFFNTENIMEIKEGDKVLIEGEIHTAQEPIISSYTPQKEEPKNDLPFVDPADIPRYISYLKSGFRTVEQFKSKFQITEGDRNQFLEAGIQI